MTEENNFGSGYKALSVIGTVLGGLATANEGGLLGGIFGGNNNGGGYVTKEALDMSMQINKLETEKSLLEADLSSERKMVDIYSKLESKINANEKEQQAINAAQAVTNTATTSALAVAQNNIQNLLSLCKLTIPNASVNPGWGDVKITPVTP